MGWYDRMAGVYDYTVERVYRRYRAQAVAALRVSDGAHVLDLACGTGLNFPHLAAAIGPSGTLIGLDFSAGMLRRATRRATRADWGGIHTLQRDARKLTQGDLDTACGHAFGFDAVIATLGLSVIPDWEAVVRNVYDLLAPGGSFVVFDIHAERRVPMTRCAELIAQADVDRKAWPLFGELGAEVRWRYLDGSPHIHGGRPYLLTAQKPAASRPDQTADTARDRQGEPST